MITLTAWKWVPDFARGLVRDLPVRWALKEAGLPYEVHLLTPAERDGAAYRARQPFGQVPVLEDSDTGLVLFESGAIVLHLMARSAALGPTNEAGRARVSAWVMAALNSVEQAVRAPDNEASLKRL